MAKAYIHIAGSLDAPAFFGECEANSEALQQAWIRYLNTEGITTSWHSEQCGEHEGTAWLVIHTHPKDGPHEVLFLSCTE